VPIIGELPFGCACGKRPKQELWVRDETMKYQNASFAVDGLQNLSYLAYQGTGAMATVIKAF